MPRAGRPSSLATGPRHLALLRPELEQRQGAPAIVLHPADAEARGLREGNVARFWPKRAAGAANANATVAERDSDMGGGAVFHDNRVEVTAGP